LTTSDVKGYVAEHYGVVEKVEWIDDTSANLVFASESAAQDAIVALSAVEIVDASQLPPMESISAKPMSTRPEVGLQIRFSVEGDKKQAGAAARSRFYLLHPEFDPEERQRRDGNRNRYRDRDSDYRHRRDDRRGRGDDGETFDASLYDDDEATLAERAGKRAPPRRRSLSPDPTDYARRNQSKELFPGRSGARRIAADRQRSRSPGRDMDRDQTMAGTSPVASDSKNKRNALSIKDRLRRDAAGETRELFPEKLGKKAHMDDMTDQAASLLDRSLGFPAEDAVEEEHQGNAMADEGGLHIRGLARQRGEQQGLAIKGAAAASVRELFPDKFGVNAGKELFAEKLDGRGRRRQRAEDLFH